SGSYRGAAHSQAAYKQAWRRVALILRGGPLATIDSRLHTLRMPPVRVGPGVAPATPKGAAQPLPDLPRPQVAMLWVPMTGGLPDIAGNQPSDYWPGRRWVDWIGTDFYSKFPNFAGLDRFYGAFRGLPFAFGE